MTSGAGEQGFLYVDLLSSLLILSLSTAVLFSSANSLMRNRAKEELLYEKSRDEYVSVLLEQTG